MRYYKMFTFNRFLAAAAIVSALPALQADEWTLFRHDGRDYVALENFANFYAFPTLPAPDGIALPSLSPPLGLGPPAPALPPLVADPPVVPVIPKQVILDNGKNHVIFAINGREAEINGVKEWLSFPTVLQDGKLLISRLDLSKTLEPRLRPEKADGLKPVKTVILDPGHGGHDKGAASSFGFEKDFALDVARRTKTILEKRGFRVLMTRNSDVFIPLHDRPAKANHEEDSIFVSIHFNSATSNPNARGFEIYSCAPRGAPATNDGAFSARDLREEPANAADTESTILAGTVYHSLLGNVPLPDRGIKHARFAVLRRCTKPAILIECGFVSSQSDCTLISQTVWRDEVAKAIAEGIQNYKEVAEQRVTPKMMADYRKGDATTPH